MRYPLGNSATNRTGADVKKKRFSEEQLITVLETFTEKAA
jgi:hypothetical protein